MVRRCQTAIATLEEAMLAQDIRRHPDGSLDFDFYRRRAARRRVQARREVFGGKVVPAAKVAIAVAILAVTVCLVPAADGSGWNGATPGSAASTALARAAAAPGRS